MPVDAQINELYAWHGHITKLNGKNTIILMNDRTMYSLVFRNRLPRNVDKFAELIKEAIPYTMEVGGFNNLEIDKYMSGLGKIIFAEKADRQMTGNLTRMFLDMEYTCDRWQENESVQAEQAAFENNGIRRQASSGMSLVFSMAPGYRDLYKYYLMLLRGLSITGDVFNISVKDLALLYEYWCFIKLNSMMKDRYELISQDIVKVQGNGLFVSLVKGSSSKVKYRNSENGEVITLSYNPKSGQVPTVAQKPDNVLSLEKKTVNQVGKKVKYEYVFDAKYRVNPALEGSDYYNTISHTPGPETDDINTMHRYRDAIVYHNGADPYERTMFGAYVLFPYANKEEYRNHKFFESIEKVNIGGLPFLPSETSMVQDMLDALIADSPDSAFERATLPRGIEDKLAKIDWNQRDVLVGALRNRAQLDTCLKYKFYHIPASKIRDADLPIHYVAIYQSINIFGREAGIRYYGEVTKTSAVKRRDIREIPKNSDEAYYRFEIKEWKELNIPLVAKEVRDFPFFTNMFLLQHCPDVPDLHISSEEEYRLYIEVRRLANDASVNETDAEPGFKYDDKTIIMENGDIVVLKDGTKIEQISIETFMRKPRESMRVIAK